MKTQTENILNLKSPTQFGIKISLLVDIHFIVRFVSG